ncbi:farnesoate epoxidase-like [Pollicipes pollicipes]|uniref:farnesoate epoxidase-like n=1 Tax=Pollicipes pollicipes TaxID=41117 RepID=UPI0018852FC9|nr:farnesoate epoxidase-like [Pollicipes pollicipes]
MLSLLLFAALLVAALVRVFLESRKNYPPGPFNIPFLGSLQQGRLINTVVHDEMKKLSDQYGNLVFLKILMDQPVLIIRGYDLVKEATHSRAFSGVGRPLTFKEHGLHRRMGLIFSDGDNWHQMRRFSLRALRDQGFGRKTRTDNINEELAEVLGSLMVAAKEGHEVQVRGLFTLAATNALLQLIIGTKLQRGGQVEHLTELVDRNVNSLGPACMHLELFPWLRHVAPRLSGFQQFHDDVQEMVDIFLPLIAEHAQSVVDDQPPRDLVEAFLQQQREQRPPHRFTKDNLRCLLKDLLMAGMETVNTVMEWVILILVLHPDVQARAAAEVDEVVGHDRTPAIDDMLAMPYLEAVIEETMRWMPALPIVQHATTFGATQLGGRHVPANCRVFIDLRSVLHDAAFWGDPECFRPERFLAPDAARLKERLLGFGFGLRRCIGETHARQALFLFTAGLLQRLRLQLSPGQADPSRPGPSLVLKPQPYRITVQTRE